MLNISFKKLKPTFNAEHDPLANGRWNFVEGDAHKSAHVASANIQQVKLLSLPFSNYKVQSHLLSHMTESVQYTVYLPLLLPLLGSATQKSLLSSRRHLMDGSGCPFARQTKLTFDPSRTFKSELVREESMSGGTATNKSYQTSNFFSLKYVLT